MNTFKMSMIMIVACGALSLSLEGAANPPSVTNPPGEKTQGIASPAKGNGSTTQEKFDLMERDEMEDSDTLAIPYDDSEVEDEEQVNRIEKKELFKLPTPK